MVPSEGLGDLRGFPLFSLIRNRVKGNAAGQICSEQGQSEEKY